MNNNRLRGLRITLQTFCLARILVKSIAQRKDVFNFRDKANKAHEWELDLLALEALELNDELIQPVEDELEPDHAWKFDTFTWGSLFRCAISRQPEALYLERT